MRPIDAPWLRHRATRCSTFKIYRHRYREIRARGRCVTAVEKSHAPRTTMNHRLPFGFQQFSACLRIPDALWGSYSVGSATFREGWRVRSSKRTRRKDRWKRTIDTGVGYDRLGHADVAAHFRPRVPFTFSRSSSFHQTTAARRNEYAE